ncbi:MAG: helix-hairpin-helix domain-containing protein [Chloroflexi bacterium]|nr:helix-hairpin-helix domain-containing protein [Chloroflexota bacterium]
MKPWQLVLLGIFFGLLSAGVILLVALSPRGEPIVLQPPPTSLPYQVYVSGAVYSPGLYSLAPNARLAEAVELAGGLLPEADIRQVNLAAPLSDGESIYIPAAGEQFSSLKPDDSTGPQASEASEAHIVYPLDLNAASQNELESLPGIGPQKAMEIIAFRQANGPFATVEGLLDVPGIGPATLENIRPQITVTGD